jgi:hypothetical protein
VLGGSGAPLTAERAFPVLSIFNIVRFPIMHLGDALSNAVQASVALQVRPPALHPAAA